MLVGPAGVEGAGLSAEVEVLLYDRTDGQDRLVLPPTEERVRSRPVLYRSREPTTVIMLDEEATGPRVFGQLPRPGRRRARPPISSAPPGPPATCPSCSAKSPPARCRRWPRRSTASITSSWLRDGSSMTRRRCRRCGGGWSRAARCG